MTPAPDAAGAPGSLYWRLEVGPGASHDEIVRAYRRLALGVHPDAHPEDPEAITRFREITEAYEVLADPDRREAYDRMSPLGHIPIRRGAAGPRVDAGSAQEQVSVTFLGSPRMEGMRDVPLRIGPVRVSPSPGTAERSSGFAGLLFEILDSWRKR